MCIMARPPGFFEGFARLRKRTDQTRKTSVSCAAEDASELGSNPGRHRLLGCHLVPFYWLKGRRKQNRCFAKILFESFAAGAREGSRKWTGNAFRHLSQKEKRQARQPAVSCLTLWWRGGGSNSRLRFVRVISCGFVVPGFRSRRNETTNPHEITLIMPAISNIQIHQTHETGNVRSAKSAQSAQSALKKLLRRGNFNPT
jgi:hypothetical protein